MVHNGLQEQALLQGLLGNDCKRAKAFLRSAVDADGPKQGRVAGLALANIGLAKDLKRGQFGIAETYLNINEAAFGHFAFVATTTIDDCLFLTLGTVTPLVSSQSGKTLAEDIQALLSSAKNVRHGKAETNLDCDLDDDSTVCPNSPDCDLDDDSTVCPNSPC